LAPLNDVHEGYQRFINNVEPVTNDINKIDMQIETNKVNFYFLSLFTSTNKKDIKFEYSVRLSVLVM
jgi:hypothetical protein